MRSTAIWSLYFVPAMAKGILAPSTTTTRLLLPVASVRRAAARSMVTVWIAAAGVRCKFAACVRAPCFDYPQHFKEQKKKANYFWGGLAVTHLAIVVQRASVCKLQ